MLIRQIDYFRVYYLVLEIYFIYPINALRFNSLNYIAINYYFLELRTLLLEEDYLLNIIFNINKTSFSLRSTQRSIVLLDKKYKKRGKKQARQQEQIIAIEYISTLEVTLLLTLIFKRKNLNLGQIPDVMLLGQAFSTSNKGQTSDIYVYKQLTTRFEPLTRRNDRKR